MREPAEPRTDGEGSIEIRVGSESLREKIIALRDRKDFHDIVDEAFALGARELKRRVRFEPGGDAPYASEEPEEEAAERICDAAFIDKAQTFLLNDALCAYMDALLGRPEPMEDFAELPSFLRTRPGGEMGLCADFDEFDDDT